MQKETCLSPEFQLQIQTQEPLLFAQPYDISAHGFYFHSLEEYNEKSANLLNHYGDLVEEFEIQFIDGDDLDCELFKALSIHQGTIGDYFNASEYFSDGQKIRIILATRECGYNFDYSTDDPDGYDIDIYELDSLRDLAEQFIEDGLFGNITENIRYYLDLDAIARDLAMDYSETTIAGKNYIFRCA